MVADYVTDDRECSVQELQQLRAMLSELAAQAEKDETSLASQITHDLYISPTDDTTSNDGHDIFSANEGASIPCTATTSRCSGSDTSLQPFDSPLGFLQTAFPHLPTSRLRSALGSSEDADEIDMEAVVESIMATEFVKELEERGLDDEVEPPVQPWETVRKRPKKKVKGKTITLGDIRQQQHTCSSFASQSPRVDPWTQFSSVASHLSDLLPSHPPSYFLSLFHSPEYPSPADALRSGLASMKSPSQLSPEYETRLAVNLFAMLTSDETLSELPDVDNERMRDDVNLAVRATLAARPGSEDAADVALDLIDLLRGLESDMLDWTVYHSPVPPSPSTFPSGGDPREVDARRTLPTGPPSPPRVPIRRATTESPRSGGSSSSSSTAQAWQTIPVISRGPLVNPHAEFIPAYNPSAKIGKGRHPRKASTLKNERKLDVLDPQWHRHKRRAGELMEASKEALMEASRAWQRGSAKTRGGEVALTYAERVSRIIPSGMQFRYIAC